MSETSDFGAFGRYTELPADQMTPSTSLPSLEVPV